MESIKQRKVGKIVQETLSEVFQKGGANIFGRAFVTITDVSLTPDLLIAKIYLSIYNIQNKDEVVSKLIGEKNHLRKKLGDKIKNQLRRIPELQFFLDESLDEVFKMEELFNKIKKSSSE